VPDAAFRADPARAGVRDVRGIPLTTEEEVLLAGACRAARRATDAVERGRIAINMLSLTQVLLSVPDLGAMRGEWGEFNPCRCRWVEHASRLRICRASGCCGPRSRRKSARSMGPPRARPTTPARRPRSCCRSAYRDKVFVNEQSQSSRPPPRVSSFSPIARGAIAVGVWARHLRHRRRRRSRPQFLSLGRDGWGRDDRPRAGAGAAQAAGRGDPRATARC